MDLSLWILLSSMFVSLKTVLCCEFPPHWHGRWYQSTFGDITISSDVMTRKGRCIQKDGDKYLISSTDTNCYKCLVITQQHTNILQYKESRCWSADSIDSICKRINGDALLYSMVKVPSQPVPCPFQGYYTFSYSNNTTGSRQCLSSPPSEIRACADESKFKFVYKHCPGMPETYNKELDFQCLATWENGEKFLYGKFTSPHLAGREQMYRCFMHSFYGMSGEMSMTADATCQGLQSPTVGFSTMKLDKVLDGSIWPRSFCHYPDFFTRRKHWRDLSGRFIIEADDGLNMFRIKDKFPGNSIEYSEDESTWSEIKMVVRCVQHVDRHSGSRIKKYIGHVTDDSCESRYRCLMIVKRNHKVLELHVGRPTSNLHTQCNDSEFIGADRHILIPDRAKPTACPAEGSFNFMDKSSDCRGKFDIGCRDKKEMEIQTNCDKTAKIELLQCLVEWREDGTRYVIAQTSGDVRKQAKCLAFRHTQSGLDVQEDNQCGKSIMVQRNGVINYILFKPAKECVASPQPKPPSPPTDTLPPKGITSDRSSIIDAGSIDNGGCRTLKSNFYIYLLVLLTILYQLRER